MTPNEIRLSHRVKRAINRIVLLPVRVRFRWSNRKRLDIWAGAVAQIRKLHDQSKELGLENIRRLHNVSLFVLLVDQDLHWLTSEMIHAVGDEHRKFIARQMAALLYEATEDLPALLGGDYRSALRAIGVDQEFFPTLNAISKQFNAFKQKHASELQEIRNLVGAHRDHNAIAQMTLIEELRPLRIQGLAAEFSVPIRALADWLTRLTANTGRFEVLLRDLGEKVKRGKAGTGP